MTQTTTDNRASDFMPLQRSSHLELWRPEFPLAAGSFEGVDPRNRVAPIVVGRQGVQLGASGSRRFCGALSTQPRVDSG